MTTREIEQRPGTTQQTNCEVAEVLEQTAQLLSAQAANPFRIAAYRTAARTIRELSRPLGEMLDEQGVDGLRELPGIGASLANSIDELLRTGRLELLNRLRGELEEDRQLHTLPGIGDELADRIRQMLAINSLDELEVAAYDGRLAAVPGIGRKRLRAIRESLSLRLGRGPELARSRAVRPRDEPAVADLLDIDRQYQHRAIHGALPHAAPHRFNPTHAAWLPILHTTLNGRSYTAMFSNTARAHERGRLHDWVVIYRDDDRGYGQWTVITSRFGPLRGRRIVRGREAECHGYYRERPAQQRLQLDAGR